MEPPFVHGKNQEAHEAEEKLRLLQSVGNGAFSDDVDDDDNDNDADIIGFQAINSSMSGSKKSTKQTNLVDI